MTCHHGGPEELSALAASLSVAASLLPLYLPSLWRRIRPLWRPQPTTLKEYP